MAYTQCVLGGYTYRANPVANVNIPVRAVTATDTLSGRYFTDWGQAASRRDITQTWPVMDATQFVALTAKAALGGTLSYTDDDGTTYTVIAFPPTFTGCVPRKRAYLGVTFRLSVVSQP